MAHRMQWEKFWYRDFCDDLKRVSLGVRGFWIFVLSEMWGQLKSEITGSYDDWSRICSCTPKEAEKAVLKLEEYDICDVIFSSRTYNSQGNHTEVTLRNRRLKNEEMVRENQRLRKQRWNEKQKRNTVVTQKDNQSDAVEDKRIRGLEDKEKNKYICDFFNSFWSEYPCRKGKKVGKNSSLEAFKKIDPSEYPILIKATTNYAFFCGEFAKDPERFLKKDYWRDWIKPPEPTKTTTPPAFRGIQKWLDKEGKKNEAGRSREICNVDVETGHSLPDGSQ